MMEDLQQAYAAYQQALYHLRYPKVSTTPCSHCSDTPLAGTKVVVRYWHSIRSLWIPRACRRGLFSGHAYAARLRESKRDLLSSWNNIQAATEIRSESRSKLVRPLFLTYPANKPTVLQVHCPKSSQTTDRGGYLVSDWSCS